MSAKMTDIFCFQLVQCENFLLFLVIYYIKLTIFSVLDGHMKQTSEYVATALGLLTF